MPAPPRKRFQIHLSTAIVMMFVAGGLNWANCGEWKTYVRDYEVSGDTMEPHNTVRIRLIGWPMQIHRLRRTAILYGPPTTYLWTDEPELYYNNWKTIPIDAAVALASLFAVWFLCEWRISRRTARKGA